MPKGVHRLDGDRPTRRKHRCEQRRGEQRRNHSDECYGIFGIPSRDVIGDDAVQRQAAAEADQNAHDHEPGGHPCHQAQHVGGASSESDADAELVSAPRHHVRHNAVKTRRGEQQRHTGEDLNSVVLKRG